MDLNLADMIEAFADTWAPVGFGGISMMGKTEKYRAFFNDLKALLEAYGKQVLLHRRLPETEHKSASKARIEDAWEKYYSESMPADPPAYLVPELRRSFYQGATALLDEILPGIDHYGDMVQVGPALLFDLKRELADFALTVRYGGA